MATMCSVCGSRIRFIKIRIKDGFICGLCQDKLPLKDYNMKSQYTADQIRVIIRLGEERDNAKPDLFQAAILKVTELGSKKDSDPFDKVREYKKLLDEGLISEEEYERKRKELLGL